ncbi:MAG: (Fe-S)-binding protein [Ardenticatenaceae bacterium]|nr:(Fe-S)-binding protein [Anaerolineales bacterium]MCB9007231.1 (Fe-S)-binding protein [Ardenticatenaceae bacterium]
MATQAETAIDSFVKKSGGRVAALLEACTRCGMCAEACHYYQATAVPEYTPVWKVELLRRAYEQRFTVAGRFKKALGIEKEITNEDIKEWKSYDYGACSLCGKCSFVCPMGIDLASLIKIVRGGLTAAGELPEGLHKKAVNQEAKGSPNGFTDKEWSEWFHSLDDEGIEIPIDKKGADSLIVFTVLEITAFRENLKHMARIMNAAGENWTVSLKARDAFNMGAVTSNGKLMKTLADRIVNTAKELGVKRVIVTECGHGFTTLRDGYPNATGEPLPFKIEHITEVMAQFFREGRIKLEKGYWDNGRTFTFHDSCRIQRTGGIMDEPREVIHHLIPTKYKELAHNRENSICCGGGGGMRGFEEGYNNRMAAFTIKIDEVKGAGADTVITTCTNCRLQFTEGFKHHNQQTEVTGLVRLVSEALVEA